MVPAAHPVRRAAALLAAPLCAACIAPGRGRDLADCFTLTLSCGPEVSVDAKATEALHLAVGGGFHVEAGCIKGDAGEAMVMTYGLPVVPFLEDGILYGRYSAFESGSWTVDHVQDECYGIHLLDEPPTNPLRAPIDRFDLELGATVLVGARAGFSPGQLLDFVAGWFGADPAGDDPVPAEATEEGQEP